MVTYDLSRDERGRPRAINATLPGDRSGVRSHKLGSTRAVIAAGCFVILVALLVIASKLPVLILGCYLVFSVLTYVAYAYDKVAAKAGAWRTKESTLHLLSMLGGWPGALIAQQKLRHKSKKQSFRTVFWTTVVVNIGVFLWMLTPTGSETVRSWISNSEIPFGHWPRGMIEWSE